MSHVLCCTEAAVPHANLVCCCGIQDEFDSLNRWLMSPSPQPEHSWQSWNAAFWQVAANASGKQMGRFSACLRAHVLKLPTLVLVLAAVARMKAAANSKLPKWAVALILAGELKQGLTQQHTDAGPVHSRLCKQLPCANLHDLVNQWHKEMSTTHTLLRQVT